jgi:hypothetical protein
LGIERPNITVVDGFPDLDPNVLGQTISRLLWTAREVPPPATWPSIAECAAPLLAASPKRYRSVRQWQRAARSVSIGPHDSQVIVERCRLDGRGGWCPAELESDEGWVR